MTSPSRIKNSSNRPSINDKILATVKDVEDYVNEIKAKPDDFAHNQLEILEKSIKKTVNALVDYEFKKDRTNLDFDVYFKHFDSAITFLIKKGNEETIKAKTDKNHEEKANELTVAINVIKHLVALLRNVQEEIHLVDVSDESYKSGTKVEKTFKAKFKDTK